MKQIYFLISAMFIGTIANAQVKMPVQAAKDVQASSVYLNTEAPVQAARVVFYTNDCNVDNCSDWSFGNGAYEVGAPWTDININFECTTDGPSGPYNQWAGGSGDGSAASPMNSTTSSNGTIMVDSDLFGADANYDANWVENCWFQTVAPIDCSEHPYVSISLETRYRCWDNGGSDDSEKCLIEVSRDGVNWPAIDNWDEASGYVIYGTDTVPSRKEVFPGYETSDTSDNPSLLEFDITAAAGGQAEVYVRFRWSGTWGYSWEIDDINVYDTPANDTRIDNYLSYTDYERSGYYEYGAWPLSQIPADLAAAAKVYNVGFEDQTNVMLDVTAAGTTAYSTPITLSYATADTLSAAYLPTALGPVTVDYLLTADAADENPGNNMASQSFEVTDLSWGRDEGTPINAAPGDGTDDYIAVSLFDIVDDVVIYAIDVAVMDGSETGTSIITHLFDGFDDNFLAEQYGGILQSTDEFDIIAGNTNAVGEPVTTWYTLVFDEPYLASAGDWLGAGFEHYGGSNVQYGESKYTQDNTAFIYGPFGSGSAYDWYYTNEVPMVRLNLNPNAVNTISEESVNTTGFEMFPSFPNPTNGVTRVQFRLDRAADVNFEVVDVTGKTVYTLDMGTQAPGYNSISVDASAFAAGVYTYTLSVDGERSTDRLMVK
ncbi:MAG: T9SS type A sorting domain-containing protein [Flavobacteriales bacterium]|nr:T9SS type A sorting domain-containing protein [Flavobacteriales bacterium]